MAAMLIVPWPETVAGTASNAEIRSSGELILRVSGPNHQWRIVRLKANKCIIGSAPYCTLRLKARGVSPVHCVILRGARTAVVRCWSPDTRLNHQAFNDALLLPGDRLSIGAVEIEIFDLGSSVPVRQETKTNEQQWQERCLSLEQEHNILVQQQRAWQVEQAELLREREQLREQLAAQTALLEEHRCLQAKNELKEIHEETFRETNFASGQPASNPVGSPGTIAELEPLEEVPFQASSAEAPVNLQEVFHRVGPKIAFSESEDEDNEEQNNQFPASQKRRWRTAESPEIAEHEDRFSSGRKVAAESVIAAQPSVSEDDALDEYINRLMERLCSSSNEKTSSHLPEARPTTETVALSRLPKPAPQPIETEATSTSAKSATQQPPTNAPTSVKPRAVAPEKHIDFSALRELANLSAYNAISRYSRRLLVSSMFSKLFVAVVALTAGIALFWLWKSSSAWELTYYAGLIALLVAVYWGVQYALLTGKLIISKSGHIDWNNTFNRRLKMVSEESRTQFEASKQAAAQAEHNGSS